MRNDWKVGAAGAALALVVVALLGAGTALSKAGRGGCHGHGPGARLDRLEAKLADLDLDAETRAAAERVIAQARTEHEARHEELRDARRALRELLEQEEPALEPAMAQVEAIGALETEAHKAKLRTMLELRSLLGADRWRELRASHRHGRSEPMAPRA